MKFRSDFVTNSSSSSFLIAISKEEKYEPIIHALVKAEGYCETSEGHRFDTTQAVDDYLFERYAYRNQTREEVLNGDEWVASWRNLAHEAINKGNAVVFKEIAYSDSGFTSFLRALAECTDGIAILKSEDE